MNFLLGLLFGLSIMKAGEFLLVRRGVSRLAANVVSLIAGALGAVLIIYLNLLPSLR